VSTTPTRPPRETSPGTPQLAPLRDGYGPDGRSEWLDVDWRQHLRSVEVDGTRVNFVEMGSGPPLVFVHGLAGCWQNWLENIPHFARSHRVIAVDLPGFGESELPPQDISIPGYGRFVDAFLGAAGVERAAVVGNSMGGFIAAEVALSHPSRVDKLVLVSAAGLVTVPPRRLALATRLAPYFHLMTARTVGRREHWVRRRGLRRTFLYGVARHPDLLQPELCYEIASGAGKPGFIDALAAVLDYDFRDRLSDITHPTLIVWGEEDRIVPVGGAHEYERLIANSRKEIFRDTGHVPMIERPHRFNALLEEFLSA
jgi:pimeloyl-ACP methyl ester carboxylesterase